MRTVRVLERRRRRQMAAIAAIAFVLLSPSLLCDQAHAFHFRSNLEPPALRSPRSITLATTTTTTTHLVLHDDDVDIDKVGSKIQLERTTNCVGESESDRRAVLSKLTQQMLGAGAALLLAPSSALAADDNNDGAPALYLAQPLGPPGSPDSKPSAPLEYLLPAARVGVYIYQTLGIAEELVRSQSSSNADERNQKVTDAIHKLDDLLLSPPSFIKPQDPKRKTGDAYSGSLPLVGEIGMAQRKQKERDERGVEAGLAPRFFEVGELLGERRQWNRLQKQEQAREEASEVRRAFNIFTTNLNFNPKKYEWTGTKEEKSRMIRSEKLPTVTSVIRSDLDLRDLYRNQVQTRLDDVRAEYQYQKKQASGGDVSEFDGTELVSLLKETQIAADKWFSFISDQDVKEALEAVRREQQQL